jgi:hypothetical protein
LNAQKPVASCISGMGDKAPSVFVVPGRPRRVVLLTILVTQLVCRLMPQLSCHRARVRLRRVMLHART